MNKRMRVLAAVIVMAAVMLACAMPSIQAQLQPEDIKSISDSVVQTLAVQQVQQVGVVDYDLINTAVAQTMSALNSQVVVAPTNTPIPPAPTATTMPCNSAIMLSENYPDYTQFNPGQTFTKTWRLKNVGYCTWNTGYRLAFMSGNSMGAPAYVNLPYNVAPGGVVDISVPMQAPAAVGTYTGNWGLYTEGNYYFGKIWVTIRSGTAPVFPAGFAVTSVATAVDATPHLCTSTFNFWANISTNGAGTVSYYWRYSADDGATYTNMATQYINFAAAGTQTVWFSPLFTVADTYLVNVYIDSPNHQHFGTVTVTCT